MASKPDYKRALGNAEAVRNYLTKLSDIGVGVPSDVRGNAEMVIAILRQACGLEDTE